LDILEVDLNQLGLLLGKGDGSFEDTQLLDAASNTSYVTAADVNGDGLADLISARFYGNDFCVWLADGHGAFPSRHCFGVGAGPRMLLAGDLNQDGRLDLATVNNAASDVSVLLGSQRSDCR
jgi:hypothetical protein